jgi:tRNA threonylcarbamoyl adenosine modification protein (Sua5/YciO/YrdC/YwlC family)
MSEIVDPVLLAEAVDAVRAGRIVGMPTDTVYGIAADPFRSEAVRGLFHAKGRQEANPIPVLTADQDQAADLGLLEGEAARMVKRHWPGSLTVVVRRAAGLPEWIGDAVRGTVGLRVPDHPVALALLRAAGPLAVTSANRSGRPPALDHSDARRRLGDSVAVYLPGRAGAGAASTVVDLSGCEARVLRRGPVSWPED